MQPPRQRVEPAAGDGLGPPFEPFTSGQHRRDGGMRLELLEQVVRRQRDVAVVQAHDHADGDQVRAHRVDERPAELAVAGGGAQRPAHRVDDPVGRLRYPPHLLDAELPHLGRVPAEGELLQCHPAQVPLGAFGEHGDLGQDLGPRFEVAERLAARAAPLVAGADADDAAVAHEQLLGRGLREDHGAALLGQPGQPPPDARQRHDEVAAVAHGRRRRDRDGPPGRQHVDRLARDRAVGRQVREGRVTEKVPQRPRDEHGARQQVRPGLTAFVEDGERRLAQRLCEVGAAVEQLAQPDGARQSCRAAANDEHADLDPIVGGARRRGNERVRVERRREVRRARHAWRARNSSISLGTITWTSPTTARSLNSKIGALGSLLTATITFEFCMPTLCCTAPEMPSATYSFGATVLPVCPTCAWRGYQPLYTAARVAPTTPPSRDASSSARANCSAPPRPMPPATTTSASSIDRPSSSRTSWLTTVARSSAGANATGSTLAWPPVSTASNAPARHSARRTGERHPTSTSTDSCNAVRRPMSSPSGAARSMRSQFNPASRRAARAAATSEASTEVENTTVS